MIRVSPLSIAASAAALLPRASLAAGAAQPASGLSDAAGILATIGGALLVMAIAIALGGRIVKRIRAAMDRRRISRILRSASCDVLEDFILPGAYGGLTHIDHGVLTSSGIFCIQTKYCDGTISGAADEPQWTNVEGNRRRSFLNPIIQNEGRVRALQNFAPEVPVASLVVFRDSVHFTAPMGDKVVRMRDLGEYLANYPFQPCDGVRLDEVWTELRSAALTDEETRKDFRAQLSFS